MKNKKVKYPLSVLSIVLMVNANVSLAEQMPPSSAMDDNSVVGYTLDDVNVLQSKIAFRKSQAELQTLEESMGTKAGAAQNGPINTIGSPLQQGAIEANQSASSNSGNQSRAPSEIKESPVSIVVENVYGDNTNMYAEIVVNGLKATVKKGDVFYKNLTVQSVNEKSFVYYTAKTKKNKVKKGASGVVTLPVVGGTSFNGVQPEKTPKDALSSPVVELPHGVQDSTSIMPQPMSAPQTSVMVPQQQGVSSVDPASLAPQRMPISLQGL